MTNSLNLAEIDTETALSLAQFFIKSGQNLLMLGGPGIGKTAIANTAIQEMRMENVYLDASLLNRSDLFGYPLLFDNKSDVVQFKSPYYLPKLKHGEVANRVLLLDEIDKADPEIFAPLLELLQFKTINGEKVNVHSCILTGNLPDDHAYSHQISQPLLDRCAKFKLLFNFEKWLIWARDNGVHELILGFLTSNPELACSSTNNTGLMMAVTSPRGWTLASDALIRARKSRIVDVETITTIIAGFVGQETAFKFSIWYRHFRHFEPTIASLIENGNCALKFEELTTTEKMVFCISAAHIAKNKFIQESKTKPKYKYVENLCKFMIEKEVALEVQAISLSNAFPFSLVTDSRYKLYQSKVFFELVSKLSIK